MLQFEEHATGNEIELNVGEKFEILLRENRTTGFRWSLISNGEPACKLLGDSFKITDGSTGKGGGHSWQFQAVQEGLGKIKLVYKRSWETERADTQSFSLGVRIRTRRT